jgi:hypothetical protein
MSAGLTSPRLSGFPTNISNQRKVSDGNGLICFEKSRYRTKGRKGFKMVPDELSRAQAGPSFVICAVDLEPTNR